MLDLSPTKLLIVFVVAVLLLGPKRLPQLGRQLGVGWRQLKALHRTLDQEVRQTIPDLPSSQELLRFARSPASLLDRLAEIPETRDPTTRPAGAAGMSAGAAEPVLGDARWPDGAGWPGGTPPFGDGLPLAEGGGATADDPSYN